MKTTQSHHKKLNDKIFLEERCNLSTVLDFLIQKIQHLASNKPYPDVHPYSVGYDYEDRQDLMYKKQRNYETEQEIQSLSEFQDSPYFARMDFSILREQTEYEKIYIGKKGLNIDGQQLVYDWRSPVGQRYYIKSATEFDHNEYKFTLLLRRALSISKGQLASYNDEYVYGDEIFKEGITDPFLVNALREKKNEHRLTDIIKTIQENQNNIIRFSARKSFILQGCAGSGKTMIMLHRLSHMIFNNPQSDFSKIKIITPNDNFNIHINDLYTELGLNKIERYKVDDYYVYLLKQYAPERWKKKPMIMSDSALDEQFINGIYSEDFYSSCASKYSSYVKHIYDELSIDTVNQICSIHDLNEVYTSSKSDYDSINRYRDFIRRILEINERNISELKKTLKQIHETQMKLDFQENDTSLRTMIEIYEKDKLRLYNQIKELDNMSSECRHKCKAICDRYGFDFLVGEGLELLSSYEKILNLNAARTDIVHSWSQKLSAAEAKRQALLETYKPIINWQITQKENDQFELRQSQQEIARIPFWRFVAKQQLQVKIQELEKKLKQNQDSYLEACEAIKDADVAIYKLKTALKEFENKVANATDYIIIKECFFLEKNIYEKKSKIKEELVKLETIFAQRMQPVKDLQNSIEKFHSYADNLKQKILSDHEANLLDEKFSISQKINYEDIYNNTIKSSLDDLHQSFRLPKSKAVYRYHLFAELIFYIFWKGKIPNNDRFLNIDEGQDLAATEYLVLKAVNGEDLILNIYGDINQTITSKGVHDWNKIKGADQLFTLNENYRNTEQITEFCNRELGFSFTSIGVSGTKVNIKSLDEVYKEIQQKAVDKYTERCAIIVKDYKHSTVEKWVSLGCCQGSIRKGVISLLSVEDSKGLEFEDIYVIDDNMSKSEKYISFTRALESLVIIEM